MVDMHLSYSERQKIQEEIARYRKDPIYFIRKRVKVVHLKRGLVNFDLYPFQEDIVNSLTSNRFNILRKFRQAGCTTIAAAISLWRMLYQRHQKIVVISKDDAAAMEVLERIKLMYDEIPDVYKPRKKYSNAHKLTLKNGSSFEAKAPSPEAGRSISANLLIIDEGAFIEHIETIWAAAYPTISTGGEAFILSTVNGIGNWFYNTWKDAVRGFNEFKIMDINWESHPEYKRHEGFEWLYEQMEQWDPPINVDDWEKITKRNIGPRRWSQEYECEFLGTGDTYVDGEILRYLKVNINKNFWTKYNNRMRVWKDPEPQYEYLISVDSALGGNRDNTAFHVINIYNGEQVAEFYSNKTPINEAARIIAEVGTSYNTAYVIPERNGIGNNLIDRLFNVQEYEAIWCDDKGVMGLQVTQKNRDQMLADMEENIRLNKFKVNSERTVDELLTFIVNDKGKAIADEGCHDDLVLSLALAAFGYKDLIGGTPMEYTSKEDFNSFILPQIQTTYKMSSYGGMTDEEYLGWMIDKKVS